MAIKHYRKRITESYIDELTDELRADASVYLKKRLNNLRQLRSSAKTESQIKFVEDQIADLSDNFDTFVDNEVKHALAYRDLIEQELYSFCEFEDHKSWAYNGKHFDIQYNTKPGFVLSDRNGNTVSYKGACTKAGLIKLVERLLGTTMKESVITRDNLADAIEEYFEKANDNYDIKGLTEFACNYFGKDAAEIKKYKPVFEAALTWNEDKYANAVDTVFSAQELKESFLDFAKRKAKRINESAGLDKDELLKDRDLAAYRKTTAYRNADQEGKYRMIWRYLVTEFGAKAKSEEELSDVCMEIAMYDEQQF